MLTMLFTTIGFNNSVFAQTTPLGSVVTGKVTRIAGNDRYLTAIAAANAMECTRSGNVVLVSGDSYADAISSITLARHLNAPILLTNQGLHTLNADTKLALASLHTKNVYIVGGTEVIIPEVRTELKLAGYKLIELGGLNRYETNVKVANELVSLGVRTGSVMVVGGDNYPDALSVASVMSNKDKILLLANTSLINSKGAIDFINTKKPGVTIIGTVNMVSDKVRNAMTGDIERINGGKTRYDTNKIILDTFGTFDLDFNKMYIVSGNDFPDALATAPLAGCYAAPLLLVNTRIGDSTYKTSTDFVLNYLKIHYYQYSQINVVGGNGAVSDAFVTSINTTIPSK